MLRAQKPNHTLDNSEINNVECLENEDIDWGLFFFFFFLFPLLYGNSNRRLDQIYSGQARVRLMQIQLLETTLVMVGVFFFGIP